MLFGSSLHKSTGCSHLGSATVLSIKSGIPRDFRDAEVTSYLSAVQVEHSAKTFRAFLGEGGVYSEAVSTQKTSHIHNSSSLK